MKLKIRRSSRKRKRLSGFLARKRRRHGKSAGPGKRKKHK